MVVMRTFLGCFSVRSGSLGILIITNIVLIGCITLLGVNYDNKALYQEWKVFLNEKAGDCVEKGEDCVEKSGDCVEKADKETFHCIVVEFAESKAIVIVVLAILSIYLLCGILGLIGHCKSSVTLMMFWIVCSFVVLVFSFAIIVLMVTLQTLFLGDREDNIYVVLKGIVQFMLLVICSYCWLCVVSYVQILKCIQKLGLNDVQSILQKSDEDDGQDSNVVSISRSETASIYDGK